MVHESPLASAFASPGPRKPATAGRRSYTALSATKRKRDQLDRRDYQLPLGNSLATPSQLSHRQLTGKYFLHPSASSISVSGRLFSKLFSTGVFIMNVSDTDRPLMQLLDVRNEEPEQQASALLISKPDARDFEYLADCGMGPMNTFDLVSCSEDGRMVLFNTKCRFESASSAAGQNVYCDGNHVVCKVHLDSAIGEEITAVCHAGNVIVLGSSRCNLYLIRRYGKTLTADKFLRRAPPGSLLTGLLYTGSKLMERFIPRQTDGTIERFISEDSIVGEQRRSNVYRTQQGIIKLIPVPLSFHLLAIGTETVTLWSDWSNPGSEHIIWECSVRIAIEEDIIKCFYRDIAEGAAEIRKGNCHVVDAVLIQSGTQKDCPLLLILSVHQLSIKRRSNESWRIEKQMWLHTFDCPLDCRTGTFAGTLSLQHRQRISWDVQYRGFIPSRVRTEDNTLTSDGVKDDYLMPGMFQANESTRVFICFRPSLASTLHLLHFDARNQPPVSGVASHSGSLLQMSRYDELSQHVVDTAYAVSRILSVATVMELDGVSVVSTDGVVCLVCPSLPSPTAFVLQPNSKPTLDSSCPSIDNIASMLYNACWDQKSITYRLEDEVRAAFASHDLLEVAPMLKDVSCQIRDYCSRTGELWGTTSVENFSSSSDADRGNQEQQRSLGQNSPSKMISFKDDRLQLTRYQLAHRMVLDKLAAHNRYVSLLQATGAFSLAELKDAIVTHHQQLALVAGFATAVEEAQQRLNNISISTGAQSSGVRDDGSIELNTVLIAAQDTLQVVSRGMERMVTTKLGMRKKDIDSSGLSLAHKFYANPSFIIEGLAHIISELKDSKNSAIGINASASWQAAFNISSILLYALKSALESVGAESSVTCINTNEQLREVLLVLMNHLIANDNFTPGTNDALGQGKILAEFCRIVLQSYELEASQSKRTTQGAFSVEEDVHGEFMPKSWKNQFHHAKSRCRRLLLSKKQHSLAFTLFSDFLHAEGLMEAVYLRQADAYVENTTNLIGQQQLQFHDTTSRHRLRQILQQNAPRLVSPDDKPLLIECLEWLEDHNMPAEVISVGIATDKNLLEQFVEIRPQLAWMYHIHVGHYPDAVDAAVKYAEKIPQIAAANTVLSIAKLSAKIAAMPTMDRPLRCNRLRMVLDPEKHLQLPAMRKSTKEHRLSVAQNSFDSGASSLNVADSVDEGQLPIHGTQTVNPKLQERLDISLAIIQAQRRLCELLPGRFSDSEERLSSIVMVKRVAQYLTEYKTEAADVQNSQIQGDLRLGLPEAALCFRIALSLLSMELDAMQERKSHVDLLGEQEVVEGLYEESEMVLKQKVDSTSSALTALWASAIFADSEIILDLAPLPVIGQQEERKLRNSSLLFIVIRDAMKEALTQTVNWNLLPAGRQNCDAASAANGFLLDVETEDEINSQRANAEQLLQAALNQSGIIDWAAQEGGNAARVQFVVRACAELASRYASSSSNFDEDED